MVSITHCWKRRVAEQVSFRGRLLALLLLLWSGGVLAEGITFSAVSIAEEKGEVVADLLQTYRLTPTMVEALENGVPLTFVTQVTLVSDDAWPWQSPLVEKRLRRTLRYHPLAGSYEVQDSLSGRSRFFATREAALVALGDIKGWRILSASRLQRGKAYRVTVESWHDIGALPLPLRPKAYLSPGWHLSSKTWEWRLVP